MLRFALIPLILLILSVIFGVIVFIVYKKIKKGLKTTYTKGAELANDQQKKWADKEQRKKLPAIVQKGYEDFDSLMKIQDQLPLEWNTLLEPLIIQAKEILDEVAFDCLENNSEKALNSIRSFFHHSLDALLQLSQKLNKDNAQMTVSQVEQAQQNIILFSTDLQSHQKTLLKGRKLDFDVLMDVIKARLKK